MSDDDFGSPSRLRPFTAVLISAGASACVVAFSVGIPLSLAFNGGHRVLVGSLLVSSAAAVMAWGAMRIAISADEETIVVRNLWRTYCLRWAQVKAVEVAFGFRAQASMLTWATSPLRIRTQDGRRVCVHASVDNAELVAEYLQRSSSHAATVDWDGLK